MKVNTEIVTKFLDQLKVLISGIDETIRMGDDGFEDSIRYQVESINNAINLFTVENLTTITPIINKGLKYLSDYQKMVEEETVIAEHSNHENVTIYKAQLYWHIKQHLREIDLTDISDVELFNHIEGSAISDSKYKKPFYSKEWFYTSQQVMTDIVQEIIEQRRNAPQQKLFNEQ